METTLTKSKVAVLKDVAKFDVKPNLVIVMKSAGGRIIEVALKRGQVLPDHEAPGDALIQCLEGRANFIIEGDAMTLTAGEYVTMPKGTVHSVEAVEDSKMLIVAINPD